MDAQSRGIDVRVKLTNKRTINIDEKLRERTYKDVFLEVEHIHDNGTVEPGWMEKDLSIDYLAYAFEPSREVLLYSWPVLRRVWRRNRAAWIAEFNKKPARNKSYNSIGVCVPREVLGKALAACRVVVNEAVE